VVLYMAAILDKYSPAATVWLLQDLPAETHTWQQQQQQQQQKGRQGSTLLLLAPSQPAMLQA
jgi:hypothetical protein